MLKIEQNITDDVSHLAKWSHEATDYEEASRGLRDLRDGQHGGRVRQLQVGTVEIEKKIGLLFEPTQKC